MTSPTVSCLLSLAKEDMAALSDDEEAAPWRERYATLLGQEILQVFTTSGFEAAWPQLQQLPPTYAREKAIHDIAMGLVSQGNDKALELVWEIESDVKRLQVMLELSEEAAKGNHTKLAMALFDDARYLFSRLDAQSDAKVQFRHLLKTAKRLGDPDLVSAVKREYRDRVAATSNNQVKLLEAGAYSQSLQRAMEIKAGRERLDAITAITRKWLSDEGKETLLNEMAQNSNPLFRATAMAQLGATTARSEGKSEEALEYLEKAVEYGAGINAVDERDELYENIGKEYQKLAEREHLDLDAKILRLSKRITAWESAAGLQVSVLMSHMEAKDIDGARAITEREDSPLMWGIYHFMMMDQSKKTGDTISTIRHAREAARYFMRMEDTGIRVEAQIGLAGVLRETGEIGEGHTLVQRALAEAEKLPVSEKPPLLRKCAQELEKLGYELEAQSVLRRALEATRVIEEPTLRMNMMLDLADEMSASALASDLAQRYYEMESTLQGDALIDYYIKRAQLSDRNKDYPGARNFLERALQNSLNDKALNKVLTAGTSMFDEEGRYPYLFSLLQHPAVPERIASKRVGALFKRLLKEKKYQTARELAAIMDDEERLSALGKLFDAANGAGNAASATSLYREMEHMVKTKSLLQPIMLDAVLHKEASPLPERYREQVKKRIDALVDDGERLYYSVALLANSAPEKEQARKKIGDVMPRVMALTVPGVRAKVLILAAETLQGAQ